MEDNLQLVSGNSLSLKPASFVTSLFITKSLVEPTYDNEFTHQPLVVSLGNTLAIKKESDNRSHGCL